MKKTNWLLIAGLGALAFLFSRKKSTTEITVEETPIVDAVATSNVIAQTNLITDLPSVSNPLTFGMTCPMNVNYEDYIIEKTGLKKSYRPDECLLGQQLNRSVSFSYDYTVTGYNREMIAGSNVATSQNVTIKMWYS